MLHVNCNNNIVIAMLSERAVYSMSACNERNSMHDDLQCSEILREQFPDH